jgi:hypothetical protein
MSFSHLVKYLLLVVFLFELSGCGYKPSAKYARDIVGRKISTSVVISREDPENSVLVKDSVDKAIIEVFHSSLVDRRYADTYLSFKITNPTYSPVEYDNNGFVISYRATIKLLITRETKSTKKRYSTSGTYDFSVVPNAVLSDQERFNAIKYSAIKAISAFVAKVSAEGTRAQ